MASTTATAYAVLVGINDSAANDSLHEEFSDNATASASTLTLVNTISYGYIMQPICAIGILCNILNLFVLSHRKLSESPYVYLTALAITDLLSLIFFFLNGFPRAYYPDSSGWQVYQYRVYFTLGAMSTNMSALLTVVLTIERYIFVTYPMKARQICTPQNARKVILGIAAFAVLFDTPRFFAFDVDGENRGFGLSAFGKGEFYQGLNWFRLSVLLLGSCLLLTVLNLLLIKYVMESNKKRRVVQSTSNLRRIRDNNRLTMMLVAIIGIYIVGEIPSAFVSRAIIVPLVGVETLKKLPYRIALIIATILVILEHSLNFVVYCIYNKKFRRILKFYLVKIYKLRAPELTTDALPESKALNSVSVASNKCCGLGKEIPSDEGYSQDYLNTERFTLGDVSVTNTNGSTNNFCERMSIVKMDISDDALQSCKGYRETDSMLRDSNRNLTSTKDKDVIANGKENLRL